MCGILITIHLNWVGILHYGLRDAKFMITPIDRQNGRGVRAIVLNKTAFIQIVSSDLIRIFHDRKYVFYCPGHHTALFTYFAVHRVSLSRLRWSKENDGAILSFNKVLHQWLNTLAIEFVLSLCLTEDIVELKNISIVAI